MEDNLPKEETFAPSIFAQANEIAKEENLALPTGDQPTNDKLEIDEETAKILVELPFDVSSILTKVDEVKLVDSEATKLAKLWRRPLERLLASNPNSDILIASLATLAIAGEKYAEYESVIKRRNRARTEGERKDKQSQDKTN